MKQLVKFNLLKINNVTLSGLFMMDEWS